MFVAVGPEGVAFCNRKTGDVESLPWSRVGEAHMDGRDAMYIVIDGEQRKPDAWRGNVSEAEACVDYINEYREDPRKLLP